MRIGEHASLAASAEKPNEMILRDLKAKLEPGTVLAGGPEPMHEEMQAIDPLDGETVVRYSAY